ncbi:SCP2 sterol-binding domain-containing protein [Micromonospora sp. NPDC047548]|uniref:SCP2 sterol-binding domain-containing protein n=1 Tax=Micromonospora sp. NPDC047548 TaxID=3155624 RepID=UPI0033C632BB
MATSVAEFLQGLSPRRRPELPETSAGTVRFDVRDEGHTEHWYLTLRDQRLDVTRSSADADLVIRGDREAFDRLANGRTHTFALLIRNDLTLRGDVRLLMTLRRVFPGPAEARHPREVARRGDGRR